MATLGTEPGQVQSPGVPPEAPWCLQPQNFQGDFSVEDEEQMGSQRPTPIGKEWNLKLTQRVLGAWGRPFLRTRT